MTEFDQSKALFRVRITFQLLKLMNSLSLLMKSSAANEVDSVFVLFTAQSENNIVTVLSCKAEQQQGVKIGRFHCLPYLPYCHGTVNVQVFSDHLISTALLR